MAQERQDRALARVEEVSSALAELALRLERAAADLESALTDLLEPSKSAELADQLRVPIDADAERVQAERVDVVQEPRERAEDGLERESELAVERRSGTDRRAEQDRRQAELEGLAARILQAIDRRSGTERRSGEARRSDDTESVSP